MYTYKVMIHPNNKQATKIRRTLNKCIECQNIVYDYLDSFLKSNTKLPSCGDVRKWFTLQKQIKDSEAIKARMNMTKKEMINNHLDTLFLLHLLLLLLYNFFRLYTNHLLYN